ncbi:vitamin K epoxide reductase family protein [Mycolicibacterium sp.]|uniref:vitamin K epoxide reductase family protein n=1 Tax=Mycolicibacterium sp. TaxID=2320850 RepID=UPI0028AFE9DE|nr:vitamin K epoxide reductase family protein [Mycolicibacterium sp.]
MSLATPAAAEAVEPRAGAAPGVPVGRASAWVVLIAGIVGLIASSTLLVEKIEMLKDPAFVPSCSINPVLACGSVIGTPQASVFGPPNPLFGIIAFTLVIVTGVLALTRVGLPRWYWVGLTIGTGVGLAFVHWLAFQSLYRIGALCPYCMVVWSVTVPLFAVVAAIAFRPAIESNPVANAVYQWRWPLVVLWFTGLLLLILVRFWDYWSTLI